MTAIDTGSLLEHGLRLIHHEIALSDDMIVHRSLGPVRTCPDLDSAAPPLLSTLWRLVYLQYHAGDHRAASLLADGGRVTTPIYEWEDHSLARAFEAAHTSPWTRSPGWQITGHSDGYLRVERNGLHLRCRPEELETASGGNDAQVALRMPATQRFVFPGWFVAHGLAGSNRPGSRTVRHYLSVHDPSAAALALARASAVLDETGAPYHIKIANNTSSLTRKDSFIIYCSRTDTQTVEDAVRSDILPLVDPEHEMPLFAGPVDDGWSKAVESGAEGPSLSYGQACSKAVSEGIIDAWEHGAPDWGTWWEAVSRRLSTSGIDPRQPYGWELPC